jgi:hypothetical protein
MHKLAMGMILMCVTIIISEQLRFKKKNEKSSVSS